MGIRRSHSSNVPPTTDHNITFLSEAYLLASKVRFGDARKVHFLDPHPRPDDVGPELESKIISSLVSDILSKCCDIIWRSVRSSLHFSPKNLRISKWSQSGKNGSNHPTLSISMVYNALKNKIADFTLAQSSEITKKTDHSIAISSVFLCVVYFGWYLVNPHIHMCGKGGRRVF